MVNFSFYWLITLHIWEFTLYHTEIISSVLESRQEWSDWYKSGLTLKVNKFFWSWKKFLDINSDIATCIGRYLCVYINNMLYFLWSADTKTEVQKYHTVFPLLLEALWILQAPMSTRFAVLIYIKYLFNLHVLLSILISHREFIYQSATERNLPWGFFNLGLCHAWVWMKANIHLLLPVDLAVYYALQRPQNKQEDHPLS